MKKFAWTIGMTALASTLSCAKAQAVSFAEINDAGQTLSTATSVGPGSSPLESISGTLSGTSGDADLYQIFLTGGQSFSATTSNAATDQALIDLQLGIPTNIAINPQLSLFDASGRGIYANDNFAGSSQAALISNSPFTPQESGVYYLAISGSGYNPVSAGGEIFPPLSEDIVGATGSGGQSPLTGFSGTTDSFGAGNYTIALTGAQQVPYPSSALGLFALGVLSATSGLLKNKKNKPKPVSTKTDSK